MQQNAQFVIISGRFPGELALKNGNSIPSFRINILMHIRMKLEAEIMNLGLNMDKSLLSGLEYLCAF